MLRGQTNELEHVVHSSGPPQPLHFLLGWPQGPGCGLCLGYCLRNIKVMGGFSAALLTADITPLCPRRPHQTVRGPSHWPHITLADELHGIQQLAIDYLGF